eukprot:SAG11_NODE_3227_length_2596_cov_8.763316_1_plen_93_part_10
MITLSAMRPDKARRPPPPLPLLILLAVGAGLPPGARAAEAGGGGPSPYEQMFACPGQRDHCECPYDCGRDVDRDGVPDWCDCPAARACCEAAG